MSDTITLADLTTALVLETAIDGQATANGRHPLTTWLYPLINRTYKELRSLVSQNGATFFRAFGTATAIPARAAGEDWIELPYPTEASEILGVDVQLSSTWYELTKSSFAQRRVWPGETRLDPRRRDAQGEWEVMTMPQPTTTTVTAGTIAIWPPNLSGNYKIAHLPHWVAITNTAHVFVLFPDWLEWLLTKAAIPIYQRDNKKSAAVEAAVMRNQRAEARILAHTRRHTRGVVVARRRDGLDL